VPRNSLHLTDRVSRILGRIGDLTPNSGRARMLLGRYTELGRRSTSFDIGASRRFATAKTTGSAHFTGWTKALVMRGAMPTVPCCSGLAEIVNRQTAPDGATAKLLPAPGKVSYS
jgi:hypothetical protein